MKNYKVATLCLLTYFTVQSSDYKKITTKELLKESTDLWISQQKYTQNKYKGRKKKSKNATEEPTNQSIKNKYKTTTFKPTINPVIINAIVSYTHNNTIDALQEVLLKGNKETYRNRILAMDVHLDGRQFQPEINRLIRTYNKKIDILSREWLTWKWDNILYEPDFRQNAEVQALYKEIADLKNLIKIAKEMF